MTKKKKNIIIAALASIILVIIILTSIKDVISEKPYTVKKMAFEEVISCKGEMKSQAYNKIKMPEVMMDPQLNIYHVKINDLVDEGTIVKKGDYVALLDQERIKSESTRSQEHLENYSNQLNIGKIDSTSTLTKLRNNIEEQKYDLEYKKIEIKQSIYESKSYQDKIKRQYDRAVRELEILHRNYQRELMQHQSHCAYLERRVKEYSERVEKLKEAKTASRVLAPNDGMIIYAQVHGRTREKGSSVSFWSPDIAVLPDLSKLVSESYIEEIDIAKVKIGNDVRIVVDALPNRTFMGKVIKIANIGHKVKGLENKVFDISIKTIGSSKEITHGMNTSNEIITYFNPSAYVLPLGYIFTNDTSSYVYKKINGKIQASPISVFRSNDDEAMISEGISEGDQVYLTKPE